MNCYICSRLAGFAEPVPGQDTLRLVCFEHKGPQARAYDPADLAAGALFGLPWDEAVPPVSGSSDA